MGFSRQEYWNGLPFPSPVDHVLSELSTMTHPFWVALQGMAHSFIELDKAVVHVISLISFLWLWFSFCLPSDPITSWQIDGETVETMADTVLGGSQNTADGNCSHEIKRCLLLGRKVMTNLDSILKSRDVTLPAKVCLVNAMVFPIIIYVCESWTIKKAEHRRIDAFGQWC